MPRLKTDKFFTILLAVICSCCIYIVSSSAHADAGKPDIDVIGRGMGDQVNRLIWSEIKGELKTIGLKNCPQKYINNNIYVNCATGRTAEATLSIGESRETADQKKE